MLDPLGLLNSFDCTGPTWVHPTGLPMAHAMRSLRHRHPAGPNRLLRCCSIDGFDNQQLKSLEAVVVNHEYRQLKSFIWKKNVVHYWSDTIFWLLVASRFFFRSLDSLEIFFCFFCLHHHPCSEAHHCLVKAAAWVEALQPERTSHAVKSRSLVYHRCELRKHIQHTWKVFVVEQFDEQLFNRNLAMVGLEKISHTWKHTWSFCVLLYASDIIMCTHLSPSHFNEQSWRGAQCLLTAHNV